jgi:hypothetical protein
VKLLSQFVTVINRRSQISLMHLQLGPVPLYLLFRIEGGVDGWHGASSLLIQFL